MGIPASSDSAMAAGWESFSPVTTPLARITVPPPPAPARHLRVTDGRGRRYVDRPAAQGPEFVVGGALGWQEAAWVDGGGEVLARWPLRVECSTHIEDGAAGFGRLLRELHFTMLTSAAWVGPGGAMVEGKIYRYFVYWLRDHTHTLKGMKYFSSELKSALELYADTQRPDGMVFDLIVPKPDVQGWRDYVFRKGDFVRTLNAGAANTYTLERIPVENDVEFLFVECLYRTWQATGDTAWMRRYLEQARKAVAYSTSDRYRWSNRFRLLKRGYTIDTWDFMHHDDTALTAGDNVCDIDKTTFGVMHGDNTGMAMACRMLAQMWRAVGRAEEAPQYDQLAADLLQRLDEVAWDARGYYRHHVSEDTGFQRDVGTTDETTQISLSNAYALNRGIGADKCRAIIKAYQRLHAEMPAASPGEFYLIYPPFDKGFGPHSAQWQYMNGGVSPIVAGELARGAFAAGDDVYGVDILQRMKALARRHDGHLFACYNGNPRTQPPRRTFTPLDLTNAANVSATFQPQGGWGESGNDLCSMPTGAVEYRHIPFQVHSAGRGLGVARRRPGFAREIHLPVGGPYASIYLLHTVAQPGDPAAEMDVVYADGGCERIYIAPGRQLESWFMPGSAAKSSASYLLKQSHQGWPEYQLAWRGANATFDNVGVYVWGWNNPRPDAVIKELVFRAAENDSRYFVPGITLCDTPVWFPQSDLSFGIPDGWGAAAVVYALIEGLAGVVDSSTMLETVDLQPRWSAAGIDTVQVAVTYPACGGYVAYEYRHDAAAKCLQLLVTTGGQGIQCRLPLPAKAARVAECQVNGQARVFTVDDNAATPQVRLDLHGCGPFEIRVRYA